jgi:hypothetical protein
MIERVYFQQGVCHLKQGRMKNDRHTLGRRLSRVPSLTFDTPSRKMADSLFQGNENRARVASEHGKEPGGSFAVTLPMAETARGFSSRFRDELRELRRVLNPWAVPFRQLLERSYRVLQILFVR